MFVTLSINVDAYFNFIVVLTDSESGKVLIGEFRKGQKHGKLTILMP